MRMTLLEFVQDVQKEAIGGHECDTIQRYIPYGDSSYGQVSMYLDSTFC
jgi:hypothetical protein